MRNINTRPTLAALSGATIRRKGAGRFIANAIAAAISVGLLAAGQQFGMAISHAAATSVALRSYALGIDLPAGAEAEALPAGLTDYLRPSARLAAAPVMVSAPLGIDLPAGAEAEALPAGLTDYVRPER